MIGLCGKEVDVTLDASDGIYETSDGWLFGEDWLEFPNETTEVEDFKNDPDTITITVRADDREFAHRCLDDAIDEYEKRYDWTSLEIYKARRICTFLLNKAFSKNLCPVFYKQKNCYDEPIVKCRLDFGSFPAAKEAIAAPSGKDKFNWDIGRCIDLCKAMGEPVPGFIKNKNKN